MNKRLLKLTTLALMISLCYVAFAFLQIKIPTIGGYTSFHLGNTICILASLLLGGSLGGIAGSVGMGIGDVLDPVYILVAPKTIILKFFMGFVCGYFAHRIFKINTLEKNKLNKTVFISTSMGMLTNIILEPLFSYFYYRFILNMPEKATNVIVGYNFITTFTNAILAVIIASSLYLALHSRFKNNGLLDKISPRY